MRTAINFYDREKIRNEKDIKQYDDILVVQNVTEWLFCQLNSLLGG